MQLLEGLPYELHEHLTRMAELHQLQTMVVRRLVLERLLPNIHTLDTKPHAVTLLNHHPT
ncbi:hypothetical protein BT96DRAFT_1040703 [Gymnopus androsaceus JB14]|uniref:Uncharacterized protein n=1 Tax=Gymnopus androsaceus JB14 TaxID=1447944 RepID=A0A6A4GC36_9AGAR|nr:hypothetical protein BT96DRAFT_1040703 [Gymnopus androsaceus JB14]